jgi:hypothetical protein
MTGSELIIVLQNLLVAGAVFVVCRRRDRGTEQGYRRTDAFEPLTIATGETA